MSDPNDPSGGGGDAEDPCATESLDDYDQSLAIGAVFIILVASLLGTMLPLLFKRFPRLLAWPFAVVIGKHIGTGVLLALSLIHLLTPAFDALGNPCLPVAWQEYSYAPLFALIAALMMHLIETSVLEYTIYSKQSDSSHSHGGGHSNNNNNNNSNNNNNNGAVITDSNDVNGASGAYGSLTHSSSLSKFDADDLEKDKSGVQLSKLEAGQNGHNDSRYQDPATFKAEVQAHAARTKVGEIHGNNNNISNGHTTVNTLMDEHHGHSHGILLSNQAERTVGAYILEFGLTAHSIIIGITLGVASQSDLKTLIPALTFHQFFEGFALGARLASVGFNSCNEILLTAIYSFSAPLGIAIGIGIATSYNGNSTTALLTQGSFDAISAGILLYVSFVQMLGVEFPQDYKNCGRNYLKKFSLYLAMYVGATVMAVIGKWL